MRFGINRRNTVTISIIIVNIIYFIFLEMNGGSNNTKVMLEYGAAFPDNIENGEYYRLVTSMFMHFGIDHIANNMLILVLLGGKLEDIVGHVRFFVIYMFSGVLANIASDFVQNYTGDVAVSAGASGAIFGVVGALLYALILNKGRVKDLNLYQITIALAFMLYAGFKSTGIDNTAHVAGAISGFALCMILYHKKEKIIQHSDMLYDKL